MQLTKSYKTRDRYNITYRGKTHTDIAEDHCCCVNTGMYRAHQRDTDLNVHAVLLICWFAKLYTPLFTVIMLYE